MAKVIAPLHSAEARGRVSGLIYNTWRGISYVKNKTSPCQPRTQTQLKVRAFGVQLARIWQTLGATLIEQWNQYAVDHKESDWAGSPIRLTGMNWFLRLNHRLLRAGLVIVTSVPIEAAPGPPTAFAAADGNDQSVISWTPTAGTDMLMWIHIHGPRSQGSIGSFRKAKLIQVSPGESGTVTITGLIAGRYTFWGRIVDEGSGLASTWVSDDATVI